MESIKFPEDFLYRTYPIGHGEQWYYPSFEDAKVSIVRGDYFYSNGSDTFDMFDFKDDEPMGYLTKEEINVKISYICK